MKFWEEMKATTDALTTIANAWAATAKGSEYFSFKSGMWKQLRQLFKEAMMTLYNAQ